MLLFRGLMTNFLIKRIKGAGDNTGAWRRRAEFDSHSLVRLTSPSFATALIKLNQGRHGRRESAAVQLTR